MGTPYVGEIRMFAGNFAPAGWLFCEGQLLAIAENETLFQLIGTTYGGDGQETFALPDLRGRIPIHQGNTKVLGEGAGVEQVTLTTQHLPPHTHPLVGCTASALTDVPTGNAFAGGLAYADDADATRLAPNLLGPVGGSQPLSVLQPTLCVNFIISLFGIFPSP